MLIAGFAPLSKRFFRGVLCLFNNVLFGRVLNKRVPDGPLFVSWVLTYDCNAFCTFCGTHRLKKQFAETISEKRAIEIADEIARFGTWVVGFTGGEVFLSPLLFPLIRRLKQHGLVVYVVTNGRNLQDHAKDLVDIGLDFVVVSLDTDKAEVHDELRKSDGLFNDAVEGILEIRRLRGSHGPIIKTNTVLMRENIEHSDRILKFFRSIADRVEVQPIAFDYTNSPHNRDKNRVDRFLVDDFGSAMVDKYLSENVVPFADGSKSYIKRFSDYWFDSQKLAEKIACWAPFLRMQILPNGDVMHCAANPRFGAVGNVNKDNILNVWNSAEIRKHRAIIGRKKNNCTCWTKDTSFNNLIHDVRIPNLLPAIGLKEEDFEQAMAGNKEPLK